MEKTIRELAIALEISKEAIYRKVNHSMKTELANHVIKRDGKTFISEIGQAIICQSLKRENDETEAEQTLINNVQTEVNNLVCNGEVATTVEYVKRLEKQIDLLQMRYCNEVNNSRRERETLYQLNQSLIDTFSRGQTLQLVDKQLHLQAIRPEYVNESLDKDVPKRFFKKLFKKK